MKHSAVLVFCVAVAAASAAPPAFTLHRVGSYRSEACGVGDFNGDKRPDIVAGPFVYVAPDWKAVKIRELKGTVDEKGDGYMDDFANLPMDVDGDGRLDVVSVAWFAKQSTWYRNIGLDGSPWPEQVVETNGNFEHADLWDIDNDGRRNEALPGVRRTEWYEAAKGGMAIHVVSTNAQIWGVGAGDVNGDGRNDILRPGAWYEAPADPRAPGWRERPLCLGSIEGDKPDHTPQILVCDVNGDGRNDIITSSAHKYGIFWYEQKGDRTEPSWEKHLIDSTWTQAHSLTLADLDGDGDPDLVTGKRFRAHNGKDPGDDDPPAVYWYELERKPAAKWTRHEISAGQGIGAGLGIPVVDIDGDGDLDVVVTGKWGGPAWFENRLR